MQLLTIDNNNTDGINWYLGGGVMSSVASENGSTSSGGNDYKIVIGGAHYDLTGSGAYSFIGDVQEVIILKRSRTSNPYLLNTDLNKIHSYLAVKYGITLSSNYVASNGTTVVWNRTANSGYNNDIFGIARDDNYNLYQKQSQSVSRPIFTAFVGNSVMHLNSANISGHLENGVYAMFGSNGGNSTIDISNPADQYTVPGTTEKLNYRTALIYKTQITGAGSLKIKLKPSANNVVPEYMLISMDPAFPVGATEVVPFRDVVIEKELQNGCYISFGGHKTRSDQGPGGVNNNLKLWLRADDETSITTELLQIGNSRLRDYPDIVTEGATVPAVSEWKDIIRNKTYSYAAGGASDADHLQPVYQQSNYMTNFHPAVRFWANANSRSTWLGNTAGIWSSQYPTNAKHSAFFVVNNHFGTHSWIYSMMFGSATGDTNYDGPGYGVEKPSATSDDIVGRFRTSSTQGTGSADLFTPGATSILGYHHWWPDGNTSSSSSVKFRFNGLEDTRTGISNGGFDLSEPSMIGKGYTHNRGIVGVMSEVIMYDGELSPGSLQLIESYLAIKYGITLTPTNHARQRFDYLFSDGSMLWNGTAGVGTKWDTYYNRIAAVIRDDDADLYNRQSHSTNVGSILHMGVAGTRLGTHVDVGSLDYDREAVIWGDDNAIGTNEVNAPDKCGDFERIFNRKWLIHKITDSDRPIRMLVGAENNAANQLGQGISAGDNELFSILTQGYDVCMIVADSPEKLTPGNPLFGQFKAVVPMYYIDGEHQCAYTFTDDIAYITLGYKANSNGCMSDVEFEGAKIFEWTQWTRTNYGNPVGALSKGAVDLGDGVKVVGTTVGYQYGVNAPAYYPSVTGSPVPGSLYVQRQRGALNSEVTVTIDFNTPVRPEFSLYDIDGYSGRFERVSVVGLCSGGTMFPDLSYVGNPGNSYYKISGNTATARVRRDLSPTDKRGQMNVSFQEGVTRIVIKYSITGNQPPTSSINNLIISPLRLRQIPPPPPINEDGLSFVKDVALREITTCEPVEYSFYIENVNCEPKYVNFRDTLHAKMKWKADIGMDTINAQYNSHIHFNSYEGTNILAIDSLLVPGSGILKLTATAMLDGDAVPTGTTKRFNNHAVIEYVQVVVSGHLNRKLKSADRETLAEETYFDATWAEQQTAIDSDFSTDKDNYSEDSEITVVVSLNNPNAAITDSYLNISYDAGFTYVPGSFSSTLTGASVVVPITDSVLLIAGATDGSAGFTIPTGATSFTFKLLAPSHANLVHAVDENGLPTTDITELSIEYLFTSEMSDPCVILSMNDMWGSKQLPYTDLKANDDHAATITTTPVKVDVLANDSIPDGCTPTVFVSPTSVHGGTATVVNDSILYVAAAGFLGVDSVAYFVKCGADSSAATLYILIQKPQAMKYIACPDALVTLGLGFVTISGVDYWWFNDDGTPAKATPSDTIKRAKDHSGLTQTWWAEPRFKNIRFKRYRVDLESGDCGVTNPTGCAATGTVLYKEDFGGNSPGDPLYKPEGIPEMDPVYIYDIAPSTENYNNAPLLEANKYMIAKIGEPHMPANYWHEIFDHTHPLTGEQGYFLEVNSAEAKGQFYSCQIDGLCAGTTLYFSAWINNVLKSAGFQHHVNQIFVLEDFSGNTIATYYTGDIKNGESGWKQYGFKFTVPENLSSVKLRITNNGTGSNGNDFALDDIEIRFCAPPVILNMGDSITCNKSAIDIIGQYTEDCTFGNNLTYRWEFSPAIGGGWRGVQSGTETFDCKTSPTLQNTLTIPSVTKANEGYYRLRISSPAYIDHINCSAASDSILIKLGESARVPDIRIDVCPLPDRTVRLSSFLDSTAYNTVAWEKISAPNISPNTGEIHTGMVTGTLKYKYTMRSACGENSAIAYVHPLKNRYLRKIDTIAICKDEQRSRNIQINQILGASLSANGHWIYDNTVNPDNTVVSNVKTYPASSSYNGAIIFDAYQAWVDASNPAYSTPYRGDTNAKMFVFRYTATGSCIGNLNKEIVIVVTSKY
jgi:hypothetical protein